MVGRVRHRYISLAHCRALRGTCGGAFDHQLVARRCCGPIRAPRVRRAGLPVIDPDRHGAQAVEEAGFRANRPPVIEKQLGRSALQPTMNSSAFGSRSRSLNGDGSIALNSCRSSASLVLGCLVTLTATGLAQRSAQPAAAASKLYGGGADDPPVGPGERQSVCLDQRARQRPALSSDPELSRGGSRARAGPGRAHDPA